MANDNSCTLNQASRSHYPVDEDAAAAIHQCTFSSSQEENNINHSSKFSYANTVSEHSSNIYFNSSSIFHLL